MEQTAARRARRRIVETQRRSERPNIEGIYENISALGRRLSITDPSDGTRWMVQEEDEWGWELEYIQIVSELSRVMFLKNPLIRRAVRQQGTYVFGQRFQIRWPEGKEDDATQAILDQFLSQSILNNHEYLFGLETEVRITGNLLFLCSIDEEDPVSSFCVQTIPIRQIDNRLLDEKGRLRYVRRVWRREVLDWANGERAIERVTKWYPVGYDFFQSQDKTMFGEEGVAEDAFVVHVKAGSFLHWIWGLSEVFAALDWARGYSRFLEDLARVMHSLSEFAWEAETKDSIENFKDSVRTGLSDKRALRADAISRREALESGRDQEENIFVSQPGAELNPVSARHANLDPSDGRRILLMAVAALDLTEIHMGDSDVGNHATAKVVERPIEMSYKARQALWKNVFEDMLRWVLRESGSSAKPEIVFPDVVEHNIKSRLDAIVTALENGGITDEMAARMMMEELGVKDVEFEIERWKREKDAQARISMVGGAGDGPMQTGDGGEEEFRSRDEDDPGPMSGNGVTQPGGM